MYLFRGTLPRRNLWTGSRGSTCGWSSTVTSLLICTSLQGLSHQLGFRFSPWENGRLVELEFYGSSYSNLDESYQGFQRHLEATFGQPKTTVPGSEGYLSHTWKLPRVEILHYVQEHFGPAEYVRIRKTAERIR